MKVFVVFVILGHVSQHASGVLVNEGVESVLLPCEGPWFHRATKVVWSRVGSNPSTVHQHQDNHEPYLQNQHYSGRTSMSADALKTGDFSLTLKEPNLSDSGQYVCTYYRNTHGKTEIIIPLHVLDPPTACRVRLADFLKVFLVVVLVVVLALGLYIWYKTITVSRVEVKEGEWFVKLPFQTILVLPQDVTVEWSRCAPEPMKVHEYRNGRNYLVRQDRFYCNRTKMEMWTTKDFSLTLRNPCFRDSGSYICTVHTDREIWTQKVVRLRVKAIQVVVEVGNWATTVKLPFKTTAQLPGDATVEWRRSETKIHVFKNGQDQPEDQDSSYRGRANIEENPLQTGNLSLVLIQPTNRDFGIYSCTVCRDGDVLWSRTVQLKVKERRRWFWLEGP